MCIVVMSWMKLWLVAGGSTADKSWAEDATEAGVGMPGTAVLWKLTAILSDICGPRHYYCSGASVISYVYSFLTILSSYRQLLFYCCTVIDFFSSQWVMCVSVPVWCTLIADSFVLNCSVYGASFSAVAQTLALYLDQADMLLVFYAV